MAWIQTQTGIIPIKPLCVWWLRSEMMGDCYRETSYLDDGCNDFDGRWSIVAMDIWTLLIIYNESNTATMIDNEKVWWSLWISWQFVIIWGHQNMPSSEKRMNLLGVPFIMILLSLLLFVKNGGDPHTNTNQPTVGKGHDLDISLGYPSRSQCSWSILSGLISFHVFFSVKSSQHLGLSENRLPP